MVYEKFLKHVKEQMGLALGDGYELTLRRLPKNNGLVLDGLCISKNHAPIAPAIYLNDVYEEYVDGRSIEELVQELLRIYRASEIPPDLNYDYLADYEAIRSRISCRLVHAASNDALLQKIPHVLWLDLALVFFLCIREDENGIMTALVYNRHLKTWDVTLETLKETALKNTISLFPPAISSMAHILEEMTGEACTELPKGVDAPFYVLSNTSGIGGAVCLLYPEVLKNFAEGLERDIIILPSSIHEVLLLPDEENVSYEEMSRLVAHINFTEVPSQDRLSNQVYLYSRKSNSVTLVSHSSLPVS